MDNLTNFTFNCLARDNLSSDSITDPEHWTLLPELQEPIAAGILAALYAIFFLIAFCWNLFIVVTYLVKYKLLKEPGNIFLFNYAIADFFIAVTVVMFSLVGQAAKEFVFGYTDTVRCGMCGFSGFWIIFFVFLSFHLLAALSIDRFIQLSYPLRYKQLMTPLRALVIVVIVWILNFIIAVLPFVGFGHYEFNRRVGGCLPRISGIHIVSGVNNISYSLFLAAEALIPILILTFTNVFTYRLVSRFLKVNIKRMRTFRNEEESASKEEDKKHKQQQTQLVKVFGALFITNIIASTPLFAAAISVAYGPSRATRVTDAFLVFAWFCALTNPVVHPIIESFFVKDLRSEIERAQRAISQAGRAICRARIRDNSSADTDSESMSTRFFSTSKNKNKAKEIVPTTEEVVMDEMLSETGDTSYVVADTNLSSDIMY